MLILNFSSNLKKCYFFLFPACALCQFIAMLVFLFFFMMVSRNQLEKMLDPDPH